jgi:hypothetical protein
MSCLLSIIASKSILPAIEFWQCSQKSIDCKQEGLFQDSQLYSTDSSSILMPALEWFSLLSKKIALV